MSHFNHMRWLNGPEMEIPYPGDEYNPDKLINEYGWVEVRERDEDQRFKANFWINENCGEEYTDWVYEPFGRYLFRNHEAAAMFKLMFG